VFFVFLFCAEKFLRARQDSQVACHQESGEMPQETACHQESEIETNVIRNLNE
jgi:hypothetical protein